MTEEATTKQLTDKQRLFVAEYLIDLNATQAAIRAGYSEKTAYSIGHENLSKPEIQEALQIAMSKRAERVEVTQDYVLSTIVETVDRCRQAVPVSNKDGEEIGDYKFEHNGVLKGCELLGKHLKMFTDKLSLENPDGTNLESGSSNIELARKIIYALNEAVESKNGE